MLVINDAARVDDMHQQLMRAMHADAIEQGADGYVLKGADGREAIGAPQQSAQRKIAGAGL